MCKDPASFSCRWISSFPNKFVEEIILSSLTGLGTLVKSQLIICIGLYLILQKCSMHQCICVDANSTLFDYTVFSKFEIKKCVLQLHPFLDFGHCESFAKCFKHVCLFLRESKQGRGRERGRQNLKQALCWQQWARCGAPTHELWDIDLSRSHTLNRPSHWGAPFCKLCIKDLSFSFLLKQPLGLW